MTGAAMIQKRSYGFASHGLSPSSPRQLSRGFRRSNPPRIGFVITASDGIGYAARKPLSGFRGFAERVTEGVIQCDSGTVPLMPGSYAVALYLGHAAADTHVVDDAITFEVTEHDLWGNGRLPPAAGPYVVAGRLLCDIPVPSQSRLIMTGKK